MVYKDKQQIIITSFLDMSDFRDVAINKNDWSSQLYTQHISREIYAWKDSGLNRIETDGLCYTGDVLYQLNVTTAEVV